MLCKNVERIRMGTARKSIHLRNEREQGFTNFGKEHIAKSTPTKFIHQMEAFNIENQSVPGNLLTQQFRSAYILKEVVFSQKPRKHIFFGIADDTFLFKKFNNALAPS